MEGLHKDRATLEAGLDLVRAAPKAAGRLELVVARPRVGERLVLASAVLDPALGLVGDGWSERRSAKHPEREPDPDVQIALMSARAAELVAGPRERWALAGDQLYVDLDVGVENLPEGAVLSIGDVRLRITAVPHTGCAKFMQRFGRDALAFVNSPEGKALRLRGVHARVVAGGEVRAGDPVRLA